MSDMAMKIFKGYDFMLCQDCLCVRDYTEDRNEGLERCSCGGEFCCCEECAHVLNLLNAGLFTPELSTEFFRSVLDLSLWNPKTGILTSEQVKDCVEQQQDNSTFNEEF